MSLYARNTQVSVDRSRAEIEKTLHRYGATKTATMVDREEGHAAVMFEWEKRAIRISLPLPQLHAFSKTEKGKPRAPAARDAEHEKATRQRWRALLLVLKAKFEAVEAGITTFEKEFLAFHLLPTGQTVGERVEPEMRRAIEGGHMPTLRLGMDKS